MARQSRGLLPEPLLFLFLCRKANASGEANAPRKAVYLRKTNHPLTNCAKKEGVELNRYKREKEILFTYGQKYTSSAKTSGISAADAVPGRKKRTSDESERKRKSKRGSACLNERRKLGKASRSIHFFDNIQKQE